MGILNYTTKITAEKSAAEITGLLARHGARRISTEYRDRILIGLSFEIDAPWGVATFMLPARAEAVLAVLKQQASRGEISLPIAKQTLEHARRVAWRILLNWVEVQMALIEAAQAEVAEVFLPYLQTPSGQAFYAATQDHLKALPAPKETR